MPKETAVLPRIRVMYTTALVTALVLLGAHARVQWNAQPAVAASVAAGTGALAAAPTR